MSHQAPLPNVLEAIAGVGFPATAAALAAQARRNRAAGPTLRLLEQLPDRLYRNASDVNHALGEIETLPDAEMKFWAHGASQDLEDETQARRR